LLPTSAKIVLFADRPICNILCKATVFPAVKRASLSKSMERVLLPSFSNVAVPDLEITMPPVPPDNTTSGAEPAPMPLLVMSP